MIIQNYNDLCLEIEGLELRIEDLQTSIKYNQDMLHSNEPKEMKGMVYSDMPKGCANYTSIDRIFGTLCKLESHLYLAEENLKQKRKSKMDIEGVMSKFEGLEVQVYYFRVIRGMTQEETAEIIDRTDRQVRNIEKKIKEGK